MDVLFYQQLLAVAGITNKLDSIIKFLEESQKAPPVDTCSTSHIVTTTLGELVEVSIQKPIHKVSKSSMSIVTYLIL